MVTYPIFKKVNPRAKRLSLRVDQRDGSLKLTVPRWTPQWQIDRFLNKNADWIAQRQSSALSPVSIEHDAIIPFQGVDHKIVIEKHNKRTTEISLSSSLHGLTMQSSKTVSMDYTSFSGEKTCNDDIIYIKTSREDPTTNLKRWIIDQARQTIEPLAHKKAAQIGKTISKIDLRDTSSRWGSCSTDMRLMFSWRLIMCDPDILNYVVAHEVAHLKHMDHSKQFWDLCYTLANGDADHARQWLKDNGHALMRYF
jgi:predicted metal-dependent hydrolase